MRRKRSLLTTGEMQFAAQRVLKFLRPLIAHYQNWLLYSPIDNEIDTRLIQDELESHQKMIYLPRIENDSLVFRAVHRESKLQQGQWTLEPSLDSPPWHSKEKSVILIPGVAFSQTQARIGFGKGFYDRFLSAHKGLYRIGLAYDFQILKDFDREPHDELIQSLVTPSAWWGSAPRQ